MDGFLRCWLFLRNIFRRNFSLNFAYISQNIGRNLLLDNSLEGGKESYSMSKTVKNSVDQTPEKTYVSEHRFSHVFYWLISFLESLKGWPVNIKMYVHFWGFLRNLCSTPYRARADYSIESVSNYRVVQITRKKRLWALIYGVIELLSFILA